MENKDRITDIIEESIRENWDFNAGFEQKKYDALLNSTFEKFKAEDFDNANEYDGIRRADYPTARAYFEALFSFAFEVVED